MFKRFWRNEKGTAAVMLGLSIFPLAGAAGIAIDYNRALTLRTALQVAADETALQAVYAAFAGRAFDDNANFMAVLNGPAKGALKTAEDRLGKSALVVKGEWIENASLRKAYKVTVTGKLDGSLMHAIMPGRLLDVGIRAAVLGTKSVTVAKIEGANLDPEAADYNETQAYCYNDTTKSRLGPVDPKTNQRLPFQKIADNTDAGVRAGPKVADIQCGSGEEISFLVKNIREARTSESKQRTGTPRFFYTDAVRNPTTDVLSYAVTYDGLTRNTLETILCASRSECQPRSKGGVLPNNHQTGRLPAVNARACTPGQFIYFGWEDRIPGVAGDDSDRDFDDIRMFLTCPAKQEGPLTVRFIA